MQISWAKFSEWVSFGNQVIHWNLILETSYILLDELLQVKNTCRVHYYEMISKIRCSTFVHYEYIYTENLDKSRPSESEAQKRSQIIKDNDEHNIPAHSWENASEYSSIENKLGEDL